MDLVLNEFVAYVVSSREITMLGERFIDVEDMARAIY
jgi:hypothetical protein